VSYSQPAPYKPIHSRQPGYRHWVHQQGPIAGIATGPIGLRNMVLTLDRTLGNCHWISSDATANRVYEVCEGGIIQASSFLAPALWGGLPFYFAMSQNQLTQGGGALAGEAYQGICIGHMGLNTPWIGNLGSGIQQCIQLRFNVVLSRWECWFFVSDTVNPGTLVVPAIQPSFQVDVRNCELAFDWNPPTMRFLINRQVIEQRSVGDPDFMINATLEALASGSWDMASGTYGYFCTKGSDAVHVITECGFLSGVIDEAPYPIMPPPV